MKNLTLEKLLALALPVVLSSAASAATVARLRVDPDRLAGADARGRVFLYAPDPVRSGSSISHWDPITSPNLLMEPSYNAGLPPGGLDLTTDLLQDLGWLPGSLELVFWDLDAAVANPHAGLRDPRPFGGAPGNPATTVGEARRNVLEAVTSIWERTLASPVTVDLLVSFRPLPCVEGVGAVLAAARPWGYFLGVPGLPRSDVAYPAALASSLVGDDLTRAIEDYGADMAVYVNSSLEEGCLAEGTSLYYGLDGNPPQGQFDLASILLHETAHGLGFTNLTNETTGELVFDAPSIYDTLTLDISTGRSWAEMIPAERAASAVNTRKVVWNGAAVTRRTGEVLAPGVPIVKILSKEPAGEFVAAAAEFGPALDTVGLDAPIACFIDADAAPSIVDGCSAAADPAAIAGKIALIDRGTCTFAEKVANAEAAGAVGAIIVNTASDTPVPLGGTDPAITIPALSVGRGDGSRIREAVCPGRVLTLGSGRFEVSVSWRTATGSGDASGRGLTESSGWFYFFGPDNPELVVKVLDACDLEGFGSWWFFAAGMTDVGVEITVGDKASGEVRRYSSPPGRPFQPIRDTAAFNACP